MINDSAIQGARDDRFHWNLAIGAVVSVVLLLLLFFWSGVQAAVSLWFHSGAYNHCFLILPIFFYMAWSNKSELTGLAPQPCFWGGGVVLIFASLWLLFFLGGIAEGAQFAIIGIVQGVLLTVFGWRVYLRLLFLLSYLWLLVPSGEAIIPTLQLVTAKAAAGLLDIIGIPTFREGLSIDVPSGSYLVAPGCAGLNFVMASLATSIAYAELVYRSWWRRLAFVVALLGLAVVGNALRVFLIIAIAHATNNIGNIVDDHLLYGWGFFSLLLLGAMALGQRFRQDFPSAKAVRPPVSAASSASILTAAAVAALLGVAAPMAAWIGWPDVERPVTAAAALTCSSLEPVSGNPEWPSKVNQVDALASIDCGRNGRHVHFAVAALERSVRHGKVLGVERWIAADDDWSRIDRKATILQISGQPVPVQADIETRGARRRMVWSLLWTGDAWRRPGLDAALADLKSELGGRRRAVLIIAATDIDEGDAEAESLLREFLGGQPLGQLAANNFHPVPR